MSELVMKEDWEALMEVLNKTIRLLDDKQVEPVKLSILEFFSTAGMLGLQDLADVSKQFENFLLETVAPDWNMEAATTLSFSMGALLEKMQMQEYGPKFSAGLSEVLLYLDLYGDEDGAALAPLKRSAMETFPLVPEFGIPSSTSTPGQPDDFEDILSDTHLLDDFDRILSDVPAGQESLFSEAPAPDETTPSLQHHQRERSAEIPLPRRNRNTGFVMDRVDWFKQMLRIDPFSLAFVSLAEELCFRACWREAAEVCRKGLAVHPHVLRGRVLMGWASWEMGRADEAERLLQDARADLEANGVLYKILAEISRNRGEAENADRFMALYEGLQPDGPDDLLPRAIPRAHEESPSHEKPSLLDFLSALHERFKRKPKKIPFQSPALFSDKGAQALLELLTTSVA